MTSPMTITEKILAAHAGRDSVAPGDLIEARVDLALANDITAPLAIGVFRELGAEKVFDRDRVVLVADHFVPNKDIASAQQVKLLRDFAREQRIPHYYEAGNSGIEHVILPDRGLVSPGDLVIGADSHTCTYGAVGVFSTGVGSTDLGVVMATGSIWLKVPTSIKVVLEGERRKWVGGKDLILFILGRIGVDGAVYRSLEFMGGTVAGLSMENRLTICNMAVEAGAKNGIFPPDEVTRDYLSGRTPRKGRYFQSDEGASYDRVLEIPVREIEPQVALPHSPDHVEPISRVPPIPLDQVFIGSCTNGRMGDLRIAAGILKGRRVSAGTRLIVIPGSPEIYMAAVAEGIVTDLLKAGGVIGPPSCGPCLGGHLGVLAAGERALSTTNRNFPGRMGHHESEVYLSNPAVAAASAVLGRIGSPEEL
jgi:3-isopropylmalate/(R)-2-methylmalate dehydratase large subunit